MNAIFLNNYLKYKSYTYTNQKTDTGRVVKKNNQTVCCSQETPFKFNDLSRMKAKGRHKMYRVNIIDQN